MERPYAISILHKPEFFGTKPNNNPSPFVLARGVQS
jgi:hypothetical protein